MTTSTKRGVRVPEPTRPIWTYTAWTERRLPTYVAAAASPILSLVNGAEPTRAILNREAGEKVFFTDERIMPDHGRIVGRHGFILAPGGCEWAIPAHGGCTFCFYQQAVDNYVGDLPLNAREFTALFLAGFGTMWRDCDAICYFTAGSALNPGEIPPSALQAIARVVSFAPRIRMLRVESRAQWMTEETIRPIASILARRGKTLDIAIGFETQNDRIRNVLLHKGMTRKQFESAVQIAKACGARVTAYVMLKGHWELGEGYAVEECVESIAYVFRAGVAEVQLQPLFISDDNSPMTRQYRAKNVQPPWLWSVAEVLQRTAQMGPVILGPLDTELPPPIALPTNCTRCTPIMNDLVVRWRQTLDPALWGPKHLPACACRGTWLGEVDATMAPPAVVRTSVPEPVTTEGALPFVRRA